MDFIKCLFEKIKKPLILYILDENKLLEKGGFFKEKMPVNFIA
jgi:hypothetical protein